MHKIFQLLDLSLPELKEVRVAVEKNQEKLALRQLLTYYQNKDYHGFLGPLNKRSFMQATRTMHELSEVEKNKLINRAEQAGHQRFLFAEAWDMEQTPTTVIFSGRIDWECVPDNNPEWMYLLNRQEYFNLYAQAFILTQEHRFFAFFIEQLTAWITGNPLTEERYLTTWRTIDAGSRLRNWVKSLEVFIVHPDFSATVLADILLSVGVHLDYLMRSFNPRRYRTDSIVLELNGAFLATTFFPELKISRQVNHKIQQALPTSINNQINSDKLQWRQSCPYHLEGVSKLNEMYLIGKRNQKDFPKSLERIVQQLSQDTVDLCKQEVELRNDNDRPRLWT